MIGRTLQLALLSCSACCACASIACGEASSNFDVPNYVSKADGLLNRTIDELEGSTPDFAWRDAYKYQTQHKLRFSEKTRYQVNYNQFGISYAVFVNEDFATDYSIKAANEKENRIRLFYHGIVSDSDRNRFSDLGCRSWDVGQRRYTVATRPWHGKIRVMFSTFDLAALAADGPHKQSTGGPREDDCMDLYLSSLT